MILTPCTDVFSDGFAFLTNASAKLHRLVRSCVPSPPPPCQHRAARCATTHLSVFGAVLKDILAGFEQALLCNNVNAVSSEGLSRLAKGFACSSGSCLWASTGRCAPDGRERAAEGETRQGGNHNDPGRHIAEHSRSHGGRPVCVCAALGLRGPTASEETEIQYVYHVRRRAALMSRGM